ncbi:MAG: PRC-barrel domain-containing protein [Opitutaceae bacterium]
MHQNIKKLYGAKLGATDGEIGHVKDFYFDDKSWAIRYLVVDTGSWLSGREVLLSPHAFATHPFAGAEGDIKILQVNLSRKRIEESPSIDSHRPVSRQYEEDYYRYYGWSGYWQEGGMLGVAGFPVVVPPFTPEERPHHGHNQRDDLHLRSAKAVAGYHVDATDGRVGAVDSFMVEGKSWTIRELAVETGHWYAGKTIFLRTENVDRISYTDSTVFVKLAKQDIMETAKNHVTHAAAGHS